MASEHGGYRAPANPAPVKFCLTCKEQKPLSEFQSETRASGPYRRPKCKACSSDPSRVAVRDGGTRACTRCEKTKPIAEFNRTRAGRARSTCRPCQSDEYRDYVARNREKVSAAKRAQKYRWRFNMEIADVEARFAAAGDSCEVCGIHRDATHNQTLVLDHDHNCCPGEQTCGRCVRGVLCTKCNVGLGALDDDPLRVIALMDYITGRAGLEVRCG